MRRFFVGAPLFIYSTPPFKIHPIAMQSHSRQFIGFIFFSWLIRKWQQFLFVYIPKHCYFLWIIIRWQYYGKKNYSLHHSENQVVSISRHQMIFQSPAFLRKRDSGTGVFLWILRIFYTFLTEHLWATASGMCLTKNLKKATCNQITNQLVISKKEKYSIYM